MQPAAGTDHAASVLQAGVAETGVSVAYTVLKCDAGPVLAQERVALDPEVQAPELLEQLFSTGVKLLLSKLDSVWAGQGPEVAQAQDEAQVTHAAKVSSGLSEWQYDGVVCSM
jgi:methionyl-tRNA formyltransferase